MLIGSAGMLRWLQRLFRPSSGRPETSHPKPAEPDYTRPATWEDVLTVARLLNHQGARYILVGGYALAAHGYVRMTEDVDIAVSPDMENAKKWIAALAGLPDGTTRELQGEKDPFQSDYLHAIRINDLFTVDVLPAVAGVPFTELEKHIQWLDLDGEQIPVLDLEGLLKTKQGVRPKDQADARVLKAAIDAAGKKEKPAP
jgi:hypothetical protein